MNIENSNKIKDYRDLLVWQKSRMLINKLFTFHFSLFTNEGVATIPTVIALTVLIVAISAGLAAMSIADILISQGFSQSSKALFYAEAGARDALMRIARNKNYACAVPSSGCYQIEFVSNGCSTNEGCAKITVSAATSPKVIVSEGRVKGNVRKAQVSVTFDGSANGKIESTSWQEITN